MRRAVFIFFLSVSAVVQAQVPKIGNDTLVDIATWNIEWFGSTSQGPTNEVTQFNNVKQVLNNTDIDIWSLCEVSSASAYSDLQTQLPQYAATISTFSQTQKTALFWKKDKFELITAGNVLTDNQYNYDFAGRPPLEVVLKTKDTVDTDTIYFYVLHLKAYADEESYNRRKNAGADLKSFLDANRGGKKFFVLGDWNDDLDQSIYAGSETPYKNYLNDTARYFFITKRLSDMGKRSYAFTSGSFIDQIMISKAMQPFYVDASSNVLDNMPQYISGFSNNTSDHYPVMGRFNLKRYRPVVVDPPPTGIEEFTGSNTRLFPNPADDRLMVYSNGSPEVSILDLAGKACTQDPVTTLTDHIEINTSDLQQGIYFLRITYDGAVSVHKFVVSH